MQEDRLIGLFRTVDQFGNYNYDIYEKENLFSLSPFEIPYSSCHSRQDVLDDIPEDKVLIGIAYGSKSTETVDIQFMVTGKRHPGEDKNKARSREIQEEICSSIHSFEFIRIYKADPPGRVGAYLFINETDVESFLSGIGPTLGHTDENIFAVCVVKVKLVRDIIKSIKKNRIPSEFRLENEMRMKNCWSKLNQHGRVENILNQQKSMI